MNPLEFDWDEANTKHAILDHPERSNTTDEIESLFYDPYFRPLADRVSRHGEQEYSGVAVENEGGEKHVVFVIREGKIWPITCRRASRKQRNAYHEIIRQQDSDQERKEDR